MKIGVATTRFRVRLGHRTLAAESRKTQGGRGRWRACRPQLGRRWLHYLSMDNRDLRRAEPNADLHTLFGAHLGTNAEIFPAGGGGEVVQRSNGGRIHRVLMREVLNSNSKVARPR